MNQITEKQFSAICFLILMNHHGAGIEKAHPNYIEEKLHLLDRGYGAFGFLDIQNQSSVIKFLENWGYKIPDEAKKVGLLEI